jgi:thiol-disulfide isomerase/thioredoxin
MRRRTSAALVVLPLLLAGCSTQPPDADPSATAPRNGMFEVDVDVDTTALRQLKKQAGVEPCPDGQATADPVQDGLPDMVLPCLGGGPDVNLASLRGPMVLNLWAQWCGPCREELPFYQQLHEQAGDEVSVIGIDYQDTQPRAALELVKETGVTFPLLADPAADVRVPFRVRGLPGVVLVDADGEVAHVEYVVIRSYDQLRDLVQEHLDVAL